MTTTKISKEELDKEFPDRIKDVDDVLDEAKLKTMDMGEDDFELEIWMSTDGKHTIHGKAVKKEAKHKMMIKIMEAYDYIRERYGTKQDLNVKTYSNEKKQEEEVDPETCKHLKKKFAQVKKEGKNKGRWFRTCETCGKFLGFQS